MPHDKPTPNPEIITSFPSSKPSPSASLSSIGMLEGEVLSARWQQFDLKAGVWTKPGAMTKQKTEHRVPLSGAAIRVLQDLHSGLEKDEEWVFPSKNGLHREDIKAAWRKICQAAGFMDIVKTPLGREVVRHTVRVHDLRHTYASLLASAGHSLPIIGALLGHTQAATTARYAHLLDDPLRAATEKVGVLLGKPNRTHAGREEKPSDEI